MHQYPCPQCQTPIEVSPAQAGEQTTCPECGAAFSLPRLGELKQLPRGASTPAAPAASETSAGRRAAFVALALVATAAGLIAAFCTARWALIEVPITTEGHIAELRAQYQEISAAHLVREWEHLQHRGLDLLAPLPYHQRLLTKQRWGRAAAIAATVCLAAALGAGLLARAPGGAPPADT